MTPFEILDRSQLRPKTRESYRRAFRGWMAFAPDSSTWSPMVVEAWRDLMLSQGYQPATVNNGVAAIRYLGRRVEALGLGPNFAKGAESLRGHHAVKRLALTADEASKLLGTCDLDYPLGVRDSAILTLGMRTAVRASGLCNLEWENVERDQMEVEAKGGHLHMVSLDDSCRTSLGAWRQKLRRMLGRAPDGRVFRSIRSSLKTNRSEPGDSLTRQGLYKMVRKRGDDARLGRPVHPHLLRHTFVVWALEAGIPLNKIMAQTGHGSLQTLSQYVSDPSFTDDPIGNYLPKI